VNHVDLILFGPPGAGKGTQAKRLAVLLELPHISTGDLMRAERTAGTALGKRFEHFMSQGLLVPDELVLDLLDKRLGESDTAKGAIFDGYPRTAEQARALDRVLQKRGRKIHQLISIEVPLQEMIERAEGRRIHEATGRIYHLRSDPPPAELQGSLTQRVDDREEVVRKRFTEYQDKTQPVLEHYRKLGVVVAIDGVGTLDDVTARLSAVLRD
jgi:adenylate kinase